MCSDVSLFCKNEKEMNEEVRDLFSQKKFEEFDCSDISKLLWKMNLTEYQSIFEKNKIDGEYVSMMIDDPKIWEQLNVYTVDHYFMVFNFEMMKTPGYWKTFSADYDPDCFVCSHASPEKTINLLKEYDLPCDSELIRDMEYCTPVLIFPAFREIVVPDALSANGRKQMKELIKWRETHKKHLNSLSKKEGIKRKFLENNEEECQFKKRKLTHE